MTDENIIPRGPRGKRPPEPECQDKTCQDAKTNLKNMFKIHNSTPGAECPLDRETLGRYTWSLLHTIAAKYPSRPTTEDKSDMREFIRIFAKIYPCSYCAQEFAKDMKEMPVQVESRNALANWFCQIHNRVNVRLNKKQFDCSKVDERWRTGWRDGSCL